MSIEHLTPPRTDLNIEKVHGSEDLIGPLKLFAVTITLSDVGTWGGAKKISIEIEARPMDPDSDSNFWLGNDGITKSKVHYGNAEGDSLSSLQRINAVSHQEAMKKAYIQAIEHGLIPINTPFTTDQETPAQKPKKKDKQKRLTHSQQKKNKQKKKN
jgi:hypothetical protein